MAEVPPIEPETVLGGFHETYRRIGVTAERTCQTAAQSFAIAELLVAKGVVGLDELDQRRRAVEERIRTTMAEAGVVVELADEVDKYGEDLVEVEIDCADRIGLCHAACCRLRFALTQQDIAEGVVQWEIPKPYLNRQRADGYCIHCDPASKGCEVYVERPAICRTYDCRRDQRIWVDFERRIPNPDLKDLAPVGRRDAGERPS
jgi:Fe-S-cluster containining protein